MYSIELQAISKKFGDVSALDPLNLAVKQGEFLTLLGPSGSGKSTLLNLIAGAYPPSRGQIFLAGRDITTMAARHRGIGMVFQNYALMPHLSVFDNVAYPLRIRRMNRSDIAQKVGEALERVGLSGFEQRKPRQLSGGQQQRVGIARCIVYSPSIIMMDEPLGALDKNLREQMQGEIKRLHQQLGITFIYVTHDQEEALNMSDRICLMHDGGISQLGTPDALYFQPKNRFVAEFIGESNIFSGHIRSQGVFHDKGGFEMKIPDEWPIGQGEILIRPEKIHLGRHGREDESEGCHIHLAGKIVDMAFVGSMTRLSLEMDNGQALLARVVSHQGNERFCLGDQLHISWDVKDMVFLGTDKDRV